MAALGRSCSLIFVGLLLLVQFITVYPADVCMPDDCPSVAISDGSRIGAGTCMKLQVYDDWMTKTMTGPRQDISFKTNEIKDGCWPPDFIRTIGGVNVEGGCSDLKRSFGPDQCGYFLLTDTENKQLFAFMCCCTTDECVEKTTDQFLKTEKAAWESHIVTIYEKLNKPMKEIYIAVGVGVGALLLVLLCICTVCCICFVQCGADKNEEADVEMQAEPTSSSDAVMKIDVPVRSPAGSRTPPISPITLAETPPNSPLPLRPQGDWKKPTTPAQLQKTPLGSPLLQRTPGDLKKQISTPTPLMKKSHTKSPAASPLPVKLKTPPGSPLLQRPSDGVKKPAVSTPTPLMKKPPVASTPKRSHSGIPHKTPKKSAHGTPPETPKKR